MTTNTTGRLCLRHFGASYTPYAPKRDVSTLQGLSWDNDYEHPPAGRSEPTKPTVHPGRVTCPLSIHRTNKTPNQQCQNLQPSIASLTPVALQPVFHIEPISAITTCITNPDPDLCNVYISRRWGSGLIVGSLALGCGLISDIDQPWHEDCHAHLPFRAEPDNVHHSGNPSHGRHPCIIGIVLGQRRL